MKTCSDCRHYAHPDYCSIKDKDVRSKLPKCKDFKPKALQFSTREQKSW